MKLSLNVEIGNNVDTLHQIEYIEGVEVTSWVYLGLQKLKIAAIVTL